MSELTPRERAILEEYHRRNVLRFAPKRDWNAELFDKQIAFKLDPSRLKAALCTRRAGKSYLAGAMLFEKAEEIPGCNVLYVALKRKSAKRIIWKDVLKAIDRKLGLGCRFNETELTCTLPNGSIIYILGLDASPDKKEEVLGQKYARSVVDECASYRQDLREIIYKYIRPALADLRGDLTMIGTPGNVTTGIFYDVTTGKEPGWAVHRWNTFDNPFMREQWAEELDFLKKSQPNIMETPLFKQMYLGEWFIDTSKLVYKYDGSKNSIRSLPIIKGDWQYLVGVDLGYDPDPTAIVVGAYNHHNKHLFIISAIKYPKIIISDLAEILRAYERKYCGAKLIVDAANKQAVEEMRQRYSLPLIAAEKHGKHGFIELMNSDFQTGVIKILESGCESLSDEYSTLVWDEEQMAKGKREENSSCPNHCCDAALYLWRYAYNYAAIPRYEKPDPHSEAAIDEHWERKERELMKPIWERDLDEAS